MKPFLLKRLPILGLALIILLLVVYLGSKEPRFLRADTVAQLFKYYSPMALLALGMTFVILTGGIDLSVGYVMMLLMFVMASQVRDHPGVSPFVAIAWGVGASLLVGGLIGAAVAYARIPSFIVTLAVMVAAYGVTLVISRNQAIGNLPDAMLALGSGEFTLGGVSFPYTMPVVLLLYAGAALLLNRTLFGRHILAVGSNREAARLSGINVPRTELLVYVLSGLCVLVAALMQIGINRNADPKVALSDSLELNAIAIVVIGGTSLTGGRGGVLGTALGALLLALIFNGLDFIGINEPSYKKMIQGGIIFLGAVLDAVQRRYVKTG